MIRPVPEKLLYEEWGDTGAIMERIMAVVDKEELTAQVKAFALQFKGNSYQDRYDRLYDLWKWCRTEIRYKKDRPPFQKIKHPARTYADRRSGVDCKSLTIFQYHICRAIGVPCLVRFAAYGGQVQHVYPVAILNGEEVPIDAVHKLFDAEVKATGTIDKKSKYWQSNTAIAGIAGTGLDLEALANVIIGTISTYRTFTGRGTDRLLWGSIAATSIIKLAK